MLGMVWPPLACGGVAWSAALAYEDTFVKEGKKAPECWSFARVMTESRRSVVVYGTLPLMWQGKRHGGWGNCGRPWTLMDIAEEHIPKDREVCRHPHMDGRAFITVLVRYDDEPYYFPDAKALLKALHQSAETEKIEISPPGFNSWNARDLDIQWNDCCSRQPTPPPPCPVLL